MVEIVCFESFSLSLEVVGVGLILLFWSLWLRLYWFCSFSGEHGCILGWCIFHW